MARPLQANEISGNHFGVRPQQADRRVGVRADIRTHESVKNHSGPEDSAMIMPVAEQA